MKKLLKNLNGVHKENRGAKFICQLALFTDREVL